MQEIVGKNQATSSLKKTANKQATKILFISPWAYERNTRISPWAYVKKTRYISPWAK
jgi:hypothetical protein